MKMNKARITAHYNTGCFCDKPELTEGIPFPTEPRFNFKKEAKALAAKIGVVDLQFSHGSYRSATALLHAPCVHHADQIVGFDWSVVYSVPA